jgi:circadian clock protein KaiB
MEPTGEPTGPEPVGQPCPHQYRLYVTAGSPISSRAVVNARTFFEAHLPGLHRLAVLDIAQHVAQARTDQIVASPTLIRLLPLPQRRFIGDMSDTARLRLSLGIASPSAEGR